MVFAGYDTSLNRTRLELLKEGAKPYLHEPFGDIVEEEWYGWRPMTPDSMPIIDRTPGMIGADLVLRGAWRAPIH